jgi:hypothetical protein
MSVRFPFIGPSTRARTSHSLAEVSENDGHKPLGARVNISMGSIGIGVEYNTGLLREFVKSKSGCSVD